MVVENAHKFRISANNCTQQNQNHRGAFAILSDPSHKDLWNVIRFFHIPGSEKRVILSGSVNNTIWIWQNGSVQSDSAYDFKVVQILQGHESSVNCITTLPEAGCFVSGSADGTIKIWQLLEGTELQDGLAGYEGIQFQLKQTINIVPKFLPLAVSLASLTASSMILAVGGTKNTVQIYISQDGEFKLVATLSGHEGWIRALEFVEDTTGECPDLLLASASQDKYIRLWRIHQGEELPAANRAMNDPTFEVLSRSLSNKAYRFESSGNKYSITFEALLLGHEDWIYTASWQKWQGKLQLLSASADNSLAVWEVDPTSGIWVCSARLGEISIQKGSSTATGSTGGFWLGLWSPCANAVVSLGRTGGWRLWKRNKEDDRWKQDIAITGHVKEVKSIAWSRSGAYLLSTGNDQTTRLHAEWKKDGKISWHEFSRPQIHGYDLNCIDVISDTEFISGADEKLLRVFDEPAAVAHLLANLSELSVDENRLFPDAASIPVLGLSNKAVEVADQEHTHGNEHVEGQDSTEKASILFKQTSEMDHPPFEDHLARHLLWPETEKLYGHGYEISCVAASNDGSLVATACRASSIDHALIRLYDTKGWLEIKPALRAHSLTVTSLEFSSDDKFLLSVGRDRQWTVFERNDEARNKYELLHANRKAHSRMVFDCSWAPIEAGRVFVTSGRDTAIKIWVMNNFGTVCLNQWFMSSPITSVSFLHRLVNDHFILAYGRESGSVSIASISRLGMMCRLEELWHLSPSKAANQLSWRPMSEAVWNKELADASSEMGNASLSLQLAVASDDTSVRILSISRLALQCMATSEGWRHPHKG